MRGGIAQSAGGGGAENAPAGCAANIRIEISRVFSAWRSSRPYGDTQLRYQSLRHMNPPRRGSQWKDELSARHRHKPQYLMKVYTLPQHECVGELFDLWVARSIKPAGTRWLAANCPKHVCPPSSSIALRQPDTLKIVAFQSGEGKGKQQGYVCSLSRRQRVIL